MQVALDLAAKGQGDVEPNPMVGCVLVKDHKIIGEGFHERCGDAHAEVNALHSIASPQLAEHATAYVTLEPCCHQGKTPPCCDALLRAGIARVVVAMRDPFPKVDGGGITQLRNAGVDVIVGTLEERARQLNAPYLKRIEHRKPWVIAKWAMTMDGRIATATGNSQWITFESARCEVHRLRSRVDAVAVGMGTVETDDPMLTARGVEPIHRISRRIVYATRRLPSLESKLVTTSRDVPVTLVVSQDFSESREETREQIQLLIESGVQVLRTTDATPNGVIEESLGHFADSGITNMMVEGGGGLLASFMAADQIDEAHVYIGAKLFGGQSALGPIGGGGVDKVTDATHFEVIRVDSFGHDVRIVYRKK